MNVTLTDEGYTPDGKWRLVPVKDVLYVGNDNWANLVRIAPNPPAELAISGEPVAYGIANSSITGKAHALMRVALEVPANDEYKGALWTPLYLHSAPNPPQPLSSWQPIETAPRDIRILLYRPTASWWWMIMGGRYESDKYAKNPKPYWCTDNWSLGKTEQRQNAPTHWMPLPEPLK